MKIALLGLGTVGRGAYDIIENRQEQIKEILGEAVEVTKIFVRPQRLEKGYEGVDSALLTADYDEILNSDVDVVVEVTGTMEQAREQMLQAMEAEKAVVTANKAVVSAYYEELQEAAKKYEVPFLFESAVGGGIPVLTPLRQMLITNEVSEVSGVLNGTCNYILNLMEEKGTSYDVALKQAQDLGYAEQDPTADVGGMDTARKLCILANMALGKVKEEELIVTGIENISAEDIRWAKSVDCKIKLVAQAALVDGKLTAVVEPVMLDQNHPLAGLPDAINAVHIEGDSIGPVTLQGPGAGKEPTGNAVVADILDIATYGGYPLLPKPEVKVANDEFKARYYVRGTALPEEIIDTLDDNQIITKEISRSELYKHLDENSFVARFEPRDE